MKISANFFVVLFVLLIFSKASIAHAEGIDSYFAWEIKNYDGYSRSNLAVYGMDVEKVDERDESLDNKLFVYDINIGKIDDVRAKLYDMIIKGEYYRAAILCEKIMVYQKVIFGTDFFDESLTELTAKLYLITGEHNAAEQKINLLLDNAQNNLIKIRAMNLKSNLLNRRGNYREALQLTQQVDELLNSTPNEKLNLINQARMARAYCGLGDIEKSAEIAEKILPQMQTTFGEGNLEMLSLMSTVSENYRMTQQYRDGLKILMDKYQTVSKTYGAKNLIVLSNVILELANYFFEIGNADSGEEFLNSVLTFANRYVDEEDNHDAFQLYTELNTLAKRHLASNNPLLLKSELGLARMNNTIGNIPQSIELCKKNLAPFRKVFGEHGDETLTLMKILGEDYLLLGNYSTAKKIIDERLNICKKNFGEHDAHTVASTIDLANVYYRTGNYRDADKLLDDLDIPQNEDIFSANRKILYNWCFSKYIGGYMKGESDANYRTFFKTSYDLEEKGFLNTAESLSLDIVRDKWCSRISSANDANVFSTFGIANIAKTILSEHHPKILETMKIVSTSFIKYGELNDAEKLAEKMLELTYKHFGKNNLCEWMALSSLAEVRRAEKNFDDALKLDEQALQIAEKVCGKKSLERFQTLDAIASDYALKENFNEAIKIRERTLAEYKKILGDGDAFTTQMMTNLAENYVAVKRYADAIKLCDETLALQKVPVYIGDQILAVDYVKDLVRIKATAQRLSGDAANAYVNYKKLIQIYEAERAPSISFNAFSSSENKAKWFAGTVPVYKAAATVATSENVGDADFSFYCTEFCKGRNLIDHFTDPLVVKNYLLTANDKNMLNEYENILSSCQAVSEYAAAINDENLRFHSETLYSTLFAGEHLLKHDLREKYSDNMVSKAEQEQNSGILSVLNWDAILANFDIKKNRQVIPDGACLIEFMKVSDDSLLVTFLRKEGEVQAATIFVDKKFFSDCEYYRELNDAADVNEDETELDNLRQKLTAELSEKLMPTLEKFAGNSKHWIISPDAELSWVPFEMLTYRDKMLIESKDVSYVPSLAVMNLMKNRERKNFYLGRSKEFFAVGDAIYDNSEWYNFDSSALELDKVSWLFEKKKILRREEATEKILRELNSSGELSKYEYMLFSAHGKFDSDSPENSAIILSQGFKDEENDGSITVGEWMNYDLRSNLIYLSACETGLGDYRTGEGIVGIPYALTVAGNKDTVMSLWQVYDEASIDFTFSVFEKLKAGQTEVFALNETKREFLNHKNPIYRNPSVWAAFLLYGI